MVDMNADPGALDAQQERRISRMVAIIAGGLVAIAAVAILLVFRFIDQERDRELQAWQIRLGIVADSRAAAVNTWLDANRAVMRELAENTSLQLYMTELAMAEGDRTAVTDEAAQAAYLRNLLVATAERAGFAPPGPRQTVAANVERPGVSGFGLVDGAGKAIVSTTGMPALTPALRAAVATALGGKPALVDLYKGATGLPTLGFVQPVFGVQDEETAIGAVIGLKVVDSDLYRHLKQPGEVARTAETVLLRAGERGIDYLSPLADGTAPLDRTLDRDTPDLAAAEALDRPGGFIQSKDYAGTDVLMVARPLEGVPWVLVRKIDRDEALANSERRLTTMLVVFVLIIVGVAGAMIAVWRHGSSLRASQAAERYRIAAERMTNLHRFMRVVTDSQPTRIVAVDEGGHYTFANLPAARDAGIPVEDMMGKTIDSVIGPAKAESLLARNRLALAENRTETGIHHFDRGDREQVLRATHVPLAADRDHSRGVLMVLDDITELTRERRRSEEMLHRLIDTLVEVVDRRDPYSAHHSHRVAQVAERIGEEMNLDGAQRRTVQTAGQLMNLGKIFVSAELLTKTGDLSDDERQILSQAYLTSADLLKNVPFEGPVVETIRQMGESWDGSGPLKMTGESILQTARILSVANAFVGMASARAYRQALPFEKVEAILLQDAGHKFDRRPVTALINVLENRGGIDQWAHFRAVPETD